MIKIDHNRLYSGNFGATGRDRLKPLGENYNYNYNYKHDGLKPLQDSNKKVSFKGFKVETIPANLSRFMNTVLDGLSGEQKKLYNKFIDDFITAAKKQEAFRKHIGLSMDIASTLSHENLIKLPQQPLLKRFFNALISPIKMFKDLGVWLIDNKVGKKLFPNIYEKIQETKRFNAIVANYKNVIGLTNFIRIQENLYRMNAGHAPIQSGSQFIIPEDILREKINCLRFKSVNPEKGQYSAKHMFLGTRFVSGSVYAVYLSNDAYNTTMRYSNSESSSQEQRKSRANQEFAKILMNIYVQNLLLGTFENQINRSMTNALLASGITVGASEVIGRMLVGRPIFPSNKENLDRMEEKMQNKKGFLASIGRLIAGDKRNKKNEETEEIQEQRPIVIEQNTFFENNISQQVNSNFFKKSNNPAFKGFSKSPYMFERKHLKAMLDYINILDPTQAKMFRDIIEKSLQSLQGKAGELFKGKNLSQILSDEAIKEIPVGQVATLPQRFANGILSPFFFVKKTLSSLFGGVKKLAGKSSDEITPEMLQKADFRAYLEKRLELPVWKTSPLSPGEKEMKLYKEFMERIDNGKLEVDGVKNLILTLEKRFKMLGITPESPNYESLDKAKKVLNDIMTRADGVNHAEYDANKVAQLNINLARTISTIFLVTDSYNLTIQYSNNDRREAVKSAKSRAVQEVSRMASSAYILAFTHSIMSKIYNGSLIGAFATVLLTSVTSDALARAVVGVPITRKSHDELLEIERKQQESKNPVQKTLAYLLGKRVK